MEEGRKGGEKGRTTGRRVEGSSKGWKEKYS